MNNLIIMNQVHLSMKTAKGRETAKFEKVFVDGYYDAVKAVLNHSPIEDTGMENQSARELGYKCGVEDTKAIIADHNTTETR